MPYLVALGHIPPESERNSGKVRTWSVSVKRKVRVDKTIVGAYKDVVSEKWDRFLR